MLTDGRGDVRDNLNSSTILMEENGDEQNAGLIVSTFIISYPQWYEIRCGASLARLQADH